MSVNRRSLLKRAAGAAALTATAIASPAIAQGARELKLVTSWPPNLPGLGSAATRVAQRITEMTDGALTVKVYAAGELVGALETLDAVATGAAEMYHAAEYYNQGKAPAFNFFTTIPFGLNVTEFPAWIYHGGGQALWDELSATFNVKAFACGNSGVQMGGWYNREINTLEDLKGLKMRMPGLGGEVFRRLGVNVVTMPGGEIFQSMQNGTIDATDWVGPWNDLAFGLHKVAKFYYYPGFHEPGASLALGINLDVWNELSQTHKQIIQTAAMAEDAYTLAEFNQQSPIALQSLIAEGVQIRPFSDDILTAFGRLSGEVVKEVAATDELAGRIYASYMLARRNGMQWGAVADEAAARMRRLDFAYE